MKTIILKVEDMACSHCEHSINVALGKLSGIKEVNASIETKSVTVTYDQEVISLEKIKEIIKSEGYTAKE